MTSNAGNRDEQTPHEPWIPVRAQPLPGGGRSTRAGLALLGDQTMSDIELHGEICEEGLLELTKGNREQLRQIGHRAIDLLADHECWQSIACDVISAMGWVGEEMLCKCCDIPFEDCIEAAKPSRLAREERRAAALAKAWGIDNAEAKEPEESTKEQQPEPSQDGDDGGPRCDVADDPKEFEERVRQYVGDDKDKLRDLAIYVVQQSGSCGWEYDVVDAIARKTDLVGVVAETFREWGIKFLQQHIDDAEKKYTKENAEEEQPEAAHNGEEVPTEPAQDSDSRTVEACNA